MRRMDLEPRPGWRQKLLDLGMDISDLVGDGPGPASPYWAEDAAYVLDAAVESLHVAVEELATMVEAAVDHVVARGRFAELGVDPELGALAARSWAADEPSLYGRFDLRWDGLGPPELLEYNADTPTALFEAAVVQWHWLEERFPAADQYNSIHEGLVETWRRWHSAGGLDRMHFACVPEDDDDLLTTAYLQDTCIQAGLETRLLDISELGWDGHRFVDADGAPVANLFKLYPWDWMVEEPFFAKLSDNPIRVVEPAWRVIAASKGILAVLWELFPEHPCLLPASFERRAIQGPAVLKPLFGREGANIVVEREGYASLATGGPYDAMSTVAQSFLPLPNFDGWHPVIGAWVIGGEARGIGIREERALVTGRGARFVPHLFWPAATS